MPDFKKNPDAMKPNAFKMKYNNSSFPFKSGEIKTVVDKERVGPVENVDLDKELIQEKMNIVQDDVKEALTVDTKKLNIKK
tara:strand:- start:375 stop:617 length:243 start_codon:yes stop_codon:yes gene_type:complete